MTIEQKTVIFQSGRNGDIMTRWEGKVAFPDRRGEQPAIGDEYEVVSAKINARGTVYFLTLGKIISTGTTRKPAYESREEARLRRERENEALLDRLAAEARALIINKYQEALDTASPIAIVHVCNYQDNPESHTYLMKWDCVTRFSEYVNADDVTEIYAWDTLTFHPDIVAADETVPTQEARCTVVYTGYLLPCTWRRDSRFSTAITRYETPHVFLTGIATDRSYAEVAAMVRAHYEPLYRASEQASHDEEQEWCATTLAMFEENRRIYQEYGLSAYYDEHFLAQHAADFIKQRYAWRGRWGEYVTTNAEARQRAARLFVMQTNGWILDNAHIGMQFEHDETTWWVNTDNQTYTYAPVPDFAITWSYDRANIGRPYMQLQCVVCVANDTIDIVLCHHIQHEAEYEIIGGVPDDVMYGSTTPSYDDVRYRRIGYDYTRVEPIIVIRCAKPDWWTPDLVCRDVIYPTPIRAEDVPCVYMKHDASGEDARTWHFTVPVATRRYQDIY